MSPFFEPLVFLLQMLHVFHMLNNIFAESYENDFQSFTPMKIVDFHYVANKLWDTAK